MERKTVTFIGHTDCMKLNDQLLVNALEKAVEEGYRMFLNGGMGQFDLKCARLLNVLKHKYKEVRSILVIPYLSFRSSSLDLFDEIIFPEELEGCHYKAAIPKRNRYLVDHADLILCYVNHTWGGAAKTYTYACRHGKQIINLGILKA